MKRIDFEMVDNKWYVINDDYSGDPEDLEMVGGADKLLDCISTDGKLASIIVYDEEEPESDKYSTLRLIEHDVYGGTYQVEDCEFYDKTVWLCNVTHLYFNGEHPEHIYFNVVNEE